MDASQELFFDCPEIAQDIKKYFLASYSWSSTLSAWIRVVCASGRLTYIPGALFVCRTMAMQGHEGMKIESAHEITDDEKKVLADFGVARLGQSADIEYVVNPNLLAGARLRKGGKEVDMSLRSLITGAREGFVGG